MEKQIIKNTQNPRAIIHLTTRLVFTPAHSSCVCIHFIEMCSRWRWDFFLTAIFFIQTFSLFIPIVSFFPGKPLAASLHLPPQLSHCPTAHSTPGGWAASVKEIPLDAENLF